MNLFTASKQLRELDELLRTRYPRAHGRSVMDRVQWLLADLENQRDQQRERAIRAEAATLAAQHITAADRHFVAQQRLTQAPRVTAHRVPTAPAPYSRDTGLPTPDVYAPSPTYSEPPPPPSHSFRSGGGGDYGGGGASADWSSGSSSDSPSSSPPDSSSSPPSSD